MGSSADSTTRELLTVGISDLKVIQSSNALITTHALGSCVGISIWDPETQVAGMLHYMLPQPASAEMAEARPIAMFATTGVPTLFRRAYELGARKERLIVCAAGAANLLSPDSNFQIGKRNRTMMRKLFWKNNIVLSAEDMEGAEARTLSLDTASGRVLVRKRCGEVVMWTT